MKIVRKVDRRSGDTLALWLNDGRVMGWWELVGGTTADDEIQRYPVYAGWTMSEEDAKAYLGTTLAALRDELTEEGKDGE